MLTLGLALSGDKTARKERRETQAIEWEERRERGEGRERERERERDRKGRGEREKERASIREGFKQRCPYFSDYRTTFLCANFCLRTRMSRSRPRCISHHNPLLLSLLRSPMQHLHCSQLRGEETLGYTCSVWGQLKKRRRQQRRRKRCQKTTG